MWHVLIVDDEPGIHQVTDLALKRFTVLDQPVKVHHAASAAEALKILAAEADVAFALIDVIMETDGAGLELCQQIRDNLKNHTLQIVLLTGQPDGPPSSVLKTLHITKHVSKPDAVVDVLRKLVEEGIAQYRAATGR